MKIGIQGGEGSTNERALEEFCAKHGWSLKEVEILYLITSQKVLEYLHAGKIEYGIFAWKSTAGLVRETQEAIKKFSYHKQDELTLQLDHALLSNGGVDTAQKIFIYSHPQAIREHSSDIKKYFPHTVIKEEIDTALAAKNLSEKKYPENSFVIAPIGCAKLYKLDVFNQELERNKSYFTTFYLIKK
jgi:prephenate dehydratase